VKSASVELSTQRKCTRRRRPAERWIALLPHSHEGYIDWGEFQRIQRMLADNLQHATATGAAKQGAALLTGPSGASAVAAS